MFWWILTGVCIVATIVGIIGQVRSVGDTEWPLFVMALGVVAGVVLAIVCVAVPISCLQDISVYQQQKVYIESHVPENSVEDAALTNKKIELNEWLYQVQYTAENYRIFVFCADEKLALKPIE